jgi:hypothetical protein
LELFFTSDRPPGWGTYVARRADISAPFGTPTRIGPTHGEISHDGLTLYGNDDATGPADIFVLNRPAPGADFGAPQNIGPGVNGPIWERWPSVSADGLELYFTRTQGFESSDGVIWVATRGSTSEPFGNATRLPAAINTGHTTAPNISADGLTLFFSSDRAGDFGAWDIWASRRPSRSGPWGAAVNLGPVVNSRLYEWQPSLSSDARTLYFTRTADGISGQIWQVSVRVIPEPATNAIAEVGVLSLVGFVWLRRLSLW